MVGVVSNDPVSVAIAGLPDHALPHDQDILHCTEAPQTLTVHYIIVMYTCLREDIIIRIAATVSLKPNCINIVCVCVCVFVCVCVCVCVCREYSRERMIE